MKQQDKIFMVVGGTALLIAAGVTGVYLFGKSDAASNIAQTTASTSTPAVGTTSASQQAPTSPNTTANTTASATSPSTTTASTASTSGYKDGTYSSTGSYTVPHGYTNSVTAKVTIASGKVTDVTVSNNYTDRESGMYIDSFMSSIKSAVVGQTPDGISLSRVGGATLTTEGFMQALSSIVSQAKA